MAFNGANMFALLDDEEGPSKPAARAVPNKSSDAPAKKPAKLPEKPGELVKCDDEDATLAAHTPWGGGFVVLDTRCIARGRSAAEVLASDVAATVAVGKHTASIAGMLRRMERKKKAD